MNSLSGVSKRIALSESPSSWTQENATKNPEPFQAIVQQLAHCKSFKASTRRQQRAGKEWLRLLRSMGCFTDYPDGSLKKKLKKIANS